MLELLLSFNGRVGRYVFGVAAAVSVLFATVVVLALGGNPLAIWETPSLMTIFFILAWPLVPMVAKRAHDLGVSGWWYVLPSVCLLSAIALLVMVLQGRIPADLLGTGLTVVMIYGMLGAWSLWHCFKLVFFAGSNEHNDYGPPPPKGIAYLYGAGVVEPAAPGAAASTLKDDGQILPGWADKALADALSQTAAADQPIVRSDAPAAIGASKSGFASGRMPAVAPTFGKRR